MPENIRYDMSAAHTRAMHSMYESYSKLLSRQCVVTSHAPTS